VIFELSKEVLSRFGAVRGDALRITVAALSEPTTAETAVLGVFGVGTVPFDPFSALTRGDALVAARRVCIGPGFVSSLKRWGRIMYGCAGPFFCPFVNQVRSDPCYLGLGSLEIIEKGSRFILWTIPWNRSPWQSKFRRSLMYYNSIARDASCFQPRIQSFSCMK
jgi:hypothetical protein